MTGDSARSAKRSRHEDVAAELVKLFGVLLGLLAVLAVLGLILGVMMSVFVGVTDAMLSTASVESAETQGAIESVEMVDERSGSFVVTLGELPDNGRLTIHIVQPNGELYADRGVAQGVERIVVPDDRTGAHSIMDGEWSIVLVSESETHGRATAQVDSHNPLPSFPLRWYGIGGVAFVFLMLPMVFYAEAKND